MPAVVGCLDAVLGRSGLSTAVTVGTPAAISPRDTGRSISSSRCKTGRFSISIDHHRWRFAMLRVRGNTH